MKLQKIKAFTLVELIIVITILAILATIGFMSFQSYTADARDGKRVSDLGEIRNGLEIYQTKNQILPIPDEQLLTVKTGSLIISYQGYLGKEVQKTIRLTNDIKDSKDNTYYTYTTNGSQTKYQLLAMLENNPNTTTYNNGILNKAFALDYTNRYTYNVGNKIGIFLTGSTNTPLQETSTGVDLSSNISTYKLVFSNNTLSGTTTSSGTRLYTEILNNQGTGGTVIQANSCAIEPVYINATFTIGTPTSVGQARQNTNVGNPCYYVCTGGYSGNDCSSKVNIVDFFGDSSGKALYRFEDNVIDDSGNYNGTAANITYSSGKFGQSIITNNTNSSIYIPVNDMRNGGTYSSRILFSGQQIIVFGAASNGGWVAQLQLSINTNGSINILMGDEISSYKLNYLTSAGILNNGWHNIVTTTDGINAKIYLDGILLINQSILSGVSYKPNIYIGQAYRDGLIKARSNGNFDQVRIFNKALSQPEVTRLYNEQ